jgi:hypothetical protein
MIWKTMIIAVLVALSISSAFLVKPSFDSESKIKIGLFHYVWYRGTLGKGHWNGTPPDDSASLAWKVVDKPVLGFYDSQNTSLIRQHLEWFRELRIDFLIISWWGPDSYEDNSTKVIFSLIEQEHSPIEIAIMVEAYDRHGVYNFTAMYDHINDKFASRSNYMKLNGKPLVLFFNDINMTGNKALQDAIHSDGRFNSKIVGHSNYVDWYAWRPCSVDSETYQKVSADGFTCVEPRYDDSYLGRNNTFDKDYSEGLYDKQWKWAIENNTNLSIVAIYSWNEYHERSQIEPHITNERYILSPFCKTYHYAAIIPEFPSFLIPLLLLVTFVFIVVMHRRKRTTDQIDDSSTSYKARQFHNGNTRGTV